MNKMQLLIMWVGIALLLLLLISPPRHYGLGGGKGKVNKDLQRTSLIAITLVTGGLIVTFKDKNKSDKVWQLFIAFWQKLTNPASRENKNTKPKDKQKQ